MRWLFLVGLGALIAVGWLRWPRTPAYETVPRWVWDEDEEPWPLPPPQ